MTVIMSPPARDRWPGRRAARGQPLEWSALLDRPDPADVLGDLGVSDVLDRADPADRCVEAVADPEDGVPRGVDGDLGAGAPQVLAVVAPGAADGDGL